MEIQGLKHKNLAVEPLRRLLNDAIKIRSQRNVVESRSSSKMLEDAIQKYKNRAIETVQVSEELIKLAKDLRDAHAHGEKLGLSEMEAGHPASICAASLSRAALPRRFSTNCRANSNAVPGPREVVRLPSTTTRSGESCAPAAVNLSSKPG